MKISPNFWVVSGLIVLAGGGYWLSQKPTENLIAQDSSTAIENVEAELRGLIDPTGEDAFEMDIIVAGQRYVLVATRGVPMKEEGGWEYSVADLQARQLKSPQTSGFYLEYVFSTPTAAVFAADDKLYYYIQNQPDLVEIPSSQLAGDESYAAKSGMGGVEFEVAQLTDSFVISVFDWQGQDVAKVRDVTFPLP